MSSERLMHWIAGRPNGMTRRPDGWQGTKIFDSQIVQNLLETLLNSRIPDKKHLYKEVILSNRM
jgi:DNA primase